MGIRRALEAELGCYMNQASIDDKYELRLVQCDGTCRLAPLIRYRGAYLGPLSTSLAIEWARALKARTGVAGAQATVAAEGNTPSEAEAAGGGAAAGDRLEPAEIADQATRAEDAGDASRGPRPPAPPGVDPARESGE